LGTDQASSPSMEPQFNCASGTTCGTKKTKMITNGSDPRNAEEHKGLAAAILFALPGAILKTEIPPAR